MGSSVSSAVELSTTSWFTDTCAASLILNGRTRTTRHKILVRCKNPQCEEMLDAIPVTWIELCDMLVYSEDPNSVLQMACAQWVFPTTT